METLTKVAEVLNPAVNYMESQEKDDPVIVLEIPKTSKREGSEIAEPSSPAFYITESQDTVFVLDTPKTSKRERSDSDTEEETVESHETMCSEKKKHIHTWLDEMDDTEEAYKWPPTGPVAERTCDADIEALRVHPTKRRKCRYCKTQCHCYTYKFEKAQNKILTTLFHNQEKHADFLEERKNQTTDEDLRMSSTFVIGQNMLVRVLLLKEGQKITSERICISFSAGVNELVTFARQFLDVVVKVVDDGFLRLSDIDHPADEELEIIRGKLYADFYTNRCGKWALLREYRLGGYLAHRLLINGATWADFKKIQRVVTDIVEVYEGLLIASHPYVEEEVVERI
jgi:hypothetical protein